MQILLNVFKFVLGTAGVLIFFYRNSQYTKLASEGTPIDAMHTVLINNHGAVAYITHDQYVHLSRLYIISAVLISLMIVIDLLQRRFLRLK